MCYLQENAKGMLIASELTDVRKLHTSALLTVMLPMTGLARLMPCV